VRRSQTGHSTDEMDLRYDAVDENDLRKAVDQMQAFWEKEEEKTGIVDQTVDSAPSGRA
jgi:hypothetical protein